MPKVVHKGHEEPLSWEGPNLKGPKPCGWTFERYFTSTGHGERYKSQGEKKKIKPSVCLPFQFPWLKPAFSKPFSIFSWAMVI